MIVLNTPLVLKVHVDNHQAEDGGGMTQEKLIERASRKFRNNLHHGNHLQQETILHSKIVEKPQETEIVQLLS